jgi:hypothetical protein
MATESLRRASVSAASDSSVDSYHPKPSIAISPEPHRQIDVNAAKNPAVHRDLGPLKLAYTVLRQCPLRDTIAILIVLLQLPPTFLSLVHLLFATLTFVPPTTSGHSSFSFTDIFEGSLGTPSVATIVVVDILVLLIWLFLWGPLQKFALDLAQTVIAMTLGGGTHGKEAGMNNVLVCLTVIGFSHFARSANIKSPGLRSLLSTSSGGLLGSDHDDPFSESPPQIHEKGAYGWARSILAIHILTQGVVRYIRQWYVRREKRDTAGSSLGDPEAAKGSVHPDPSSHDLNSTLSNGQMPENEASNALINTEKALSAKKKRKVSAQVRTRQPLWAALASTKVVMVKEYETSHSAAESAGANATDINNLGNAPFSTEADRIWITCVGFDEVCFSTSHFPSHPSTAHCNGNGDLGLSGIDKSKPFFVRVNSTVWQPTRINIATDSGSENAKGTRWNGEIFGLAAASSFEFEFVSTVDHSVLFSTSVMTLQAPSADNAAISSTLSPGPQRSRRPDSPNTTLKTSIATAELKLTEERNKQKRERKDQKTKLNSVRKELDRLSSNIASSGSSDDRLRQKVQQSNLHMKQAEEALESITAELEALERLPEDDYREYKSARAAWQSERDMHKASRAAFESDKGDSDRQLAALNSELSTIQQKRERMQVRIAKLAGEHERITDANARGLDEAQRKEREREAREFDRQQSEAMWMDRFETLEPQIQTMQATAQALWENFHAMQQVEYMAQQQQHSPDSSMGNLAYDHSENPSWPWNPPGFNVNPYVPTSMPPASQLVMPRSRGRSSSMLSNVSGFTQSSTDEMPLSMQMPISRDTAEAIDRERARYNGSGAGSGSAGTGSGDGSTGDPKSPLPDADRGRWD